MIASAVVTSMVIACVPCGIHVSGRLLGKLSLALGWSVTGTHQDFEEFPNASLILIPM